MLLRSLTSYADYNVSVWPFEAHCCNMDTAIKHPVPYSHWDKPSFVISDIRALWRLTLRAEHQSARMSKITNDGLTRSGTNEASVPLYMAFVDYKKAFDTVKHDKLWNVLKGMGLNGSTVNTLQSLYRINKRQSEWNRRLQTGSGSAKGFDKDASSHLCHSTVIQSKWWGNQLMNLPGLVSQWAAAQ